jgi:hypothetical protein
MRDCLNHEEYQALEADAREMVTPEYQEGWQAYMGGWHEGWNPFDREQNPREWDEWDEGWQAAKQTEEEEPDGGYLRSVREAEIRAINERNQRG